MTHDLPSQLRAQVAAATGSPNADAPVLKLKGDASSRAYYRVGTWPDSHVVMVMPLESLKKSDEVTAGEPPAELPFVNVHRYLDGLGIRVPRSSASTSRRG